MHHMPWTLGRNSTLFGVRQHCHSKILFYYFINITYTKVARCRHHSHVLRASVRLRKICRVRSLSYVRFSLLKTAIPCQGAISRCWGCSTYLCTSASWLFNMWRTDVSGDVIFPAWLISLPPCWIWDQLGIWVTFVSDSEAQISKNLLQIIRTQKKPDNTVFWESSC